MHAQNTLLFLIIITIRCDEELKIRIGLPEYICDKDGGVRDVSKDLTMLRLLGSDAQNVSYKFDVTFVTIGKQCTKQSCTLLKWRAVRDLEKYLKEYPVAKLQTGVIEINNTMFSPGLKYLLNVTMMQGGKIVEQKQLTLDYVDDAVRKNVMKPMASIVLLGPDSSYAYTPYVVNADVNVCSNISSYYFDWELIDSQENPATFTSKSAELTVAPETFRGSQSYLIRCSMISTMDGASMAQSEQNVKVLSKGLLLWLPVRRLTTRTGREVQVRAVMKDLDNSDGEMRVSWSCLDTTTGEQCQYSGSSSEMTFTKPGIYNVSVKISKGELTKTAYCTIEALDEAPVVDIDDIEYPTNPSQGLEIQTTVSELRAFCTLQWTSPKEEGYEPFDLSTVPGNVGDVVNVTMKEDLFLVELEEFTDGTTERKHNLVIPPPGGHWEGLKGDAKFLFRLIINCPMVDEDFNGTDVEMTTTISEVVVETNAGPKTHGLEVVPTEGVAFMTTFNFKTLKAEDKDGDGPILYKFGYMLGPKSVFMWTLGEVTNCESTLPYSEGGIQTFVETCDGFGCCTRVLGPLVTTTLDQIDKEVVLQRFLSKITGEDYNKAFTEAYTILWSYKSDETTVREVISMRITQEVDKYLKMKDGDFKNGANDLIRHINEYSPQLQLPESVLKKVVELRDQLSQPPESTSYTTRKLLTLRSKRASYLSLSDIRTYLDVSELIITTSNDPEKVAAEKENLRKQLGNYMEKLCTNMKKTQLSLELKTVIFSVERLKKTSLNTFISVPFEGNSWQVSGRIKLGNAVKETRDKCLGKAVFKDYLGKTGFTFFADVLNDAVKDASEVVIYLPKNRSKGGNPKCLVYYDGSWHSECKIMQSIAGYVKCLCKHLGYYNLLYTNKLVVTTAATTVMTSETPTAEEGGGNETLGKLQRHGRLTNGNYDTVSYVVMGVSVIGIVILAVTVRKIFHDDEENEDSETFEFPKYAQLHDEEFLTDAHI